jgi:hypothetical protein
LAIPKERQALLLVAVRGVTEYESDKTIAMAVNAILEDMPLHQQHAVFHFHVAAVFKPQRTKIEDDYADAVVVIEIQLNRRGLL